MTSDKGASSSGFDERLIAARDSVLSQGENVTAQEEGDQGQGIFLTDSQVIIAKVGITATGSSDGTIVGSFALADISAVNLRKGPLGAVIQVCTADKQCNGPEGPPDNVIVFTGSQRVKRAEAMVGRIESALGKPVNRTDVAAESPRQSPETVAQAEAPVAEPAAEQSAQPVEAPAKGKPKGGRKPSTLADEIFAELGSEEQAPVAEPVTVAAEALAPPAPQDPVPVAVDMAETADPEPAYDYGPNPYLPKPAKSTGGISRAAIVLAGLMAATLVGIAVTAPLREPATSPRAEINAGQVTRNLPLVRKQSIAVRDYRVRVAAILAPAGEALGRVEAAVTSDNQSVIAQAAKTNAIDDAWQKVGELKAPPGLAGAKDSLISGLFVGKTAVNNISATLRLRMAVDSRDAVARVRDARSQIARGLKMIDAMQAELEREAAGMRGAPKSR